MIESGFYQWAIANPKLTKYMGTADKHKPTTAFYFGYAPKGAVFPCIVLDLLKTEEEETQDPGSDEPGETVDARFQFGALAQFDINNPSNMDGFLSVCALSLALKRQLKKLGTGNSILPDGTLIKNAHFVDKLDAHYEVGGVGYLYRRVVVFDVQYVEMA